MALINEEILACSVKAAARSSAAGSGLAPADKIPRAARHHVHARSPLISSSIKEQHPRRHGTRPGCRRLDRVMKDIEARVGSPPGPRRRIRSRLLTDMSVLLRSVRPRG